MKERPILFSAPMVRAILAGQKTQTRRIAKLPRARDSFVMLDHGSGWWPYQSDDGETELCDDSCEHPYSSPYGQPGDRLWVRETWMDLLGTGVEPITGRHSRYAYRADTPAGSYGDETRKEYGLKWRPSIFMPRSASRILLEIVSIRVDRVQNISPSDAIAEGIDRTVTGDGWRRYSDSETEAAGLPPCQYPRHSYRSLWEHINGEMSWDENPWVWVIEFKRIEPPKNEG